MFPFKGNELREDAAPGKVLQSYIRVSDVNHQDISTTTVKMQSCHFYLLGGQSVGMRCLIPTILSKAKIKMSV